jgi:hypothetical protein
VVRAIKPEKVYLSNCESFTDAYPRTGHFIDNVYQTKRIHSALAHPTPAEFEAVYWAGQASDLRGLLGKVNTGF